MIYNNKRLLKGTLKLLARCHQPWLTARLLNFMARPVSRPGARSSKSPRRYCALALSLTKSGFLQDVQESFFETDDFDIICWPTYALNALAAGILSPSLNNNNYLTDDPEAEATKVRYRRFLVETWKHLCAIRPIHVVLSSNFHYYVQREFAAALEETGRPFIVLHKENLKSPGRVEFWREMYGRRGTFSGRKILVYNEIERELQIESGVTRPDKIVVTGMPRLDQVHRWRLKHAGPAAETGEPQILFLAFHRADKLPVVRTKPTAAPRYLPGFETQWGEMSWGGLCEETHRAVVELARRRPEVKIVVKTKGLSHQQDEIMQMLTAGGEPLPPNLKVVAGGDPFELLTASQVVIGFNTTGLLEALAAGKPVVVPWFDAALDPKTRAFAIELGDAADYASSPQEIIDLVCRHLDSKPAVPRDLSPAVARTLIEWTGNDDGAAGRRVLDAIRGELGLGASSAEDRPASLAGPKTKAAAAAAS